MNKFYKPQHKGKSLFARLPFQYYIVVFILILINTGVIFKGFSLLANIIIVLFTYSGVKDYWYYFEELSFNDKMVKFKVTSILGSEIFKSNIENFQFSIEYLNSRPPVTFKIIIWLDSKKYILAQDDYFWTETKLWDLAKFIYENYPNKIKINTRASFYLKYIKDK